MISSNVMIKVGGSLCSPQQLPQLVAAIQELSHTFNVIVIPGGGPFANLVRDWDRRLQLSSSASHWMAIAAMDQYGLLLESQGMGVSVDDPSTLSSPCDSARIFLPYRFLKDRDPLPHSWSITSDSVAAYLASVVKVEQLLLLKSGDGSLTSPCPVKSAVESGIVDDCFDRYLSKDTECWIVNGNFPQRLFEIRNSGCPGMLVIPYQSA